MWQVAAAQVGLSLITGMADKKAADAAAAKKRAWAEYSNRLTMLGAARNQTIVCQNAVLSGRASTKQAVEIQKNAIRANASTEVYAAANGFAGGTIDDLMLDITRNAAGAEDARQDELFNTMTNFRHERENIAATARSRMMDPNFTGGSGLNVLAKVAGTALSQYASGGFED